MRGLTLTFFSSRHELTHSAMSDVPVEEQILLKYGQLLKPLSRSDLIAESPLFCPRDDLYSVQSSRDCSDRTAALLHAAADFVDAILSLGLLLGDPHTPQFGQYEAAKSALDTFLLVENGGITHVDYVYECCRLAALMMVCAVDTGISFSEVDNTLVDQLKSTMQKTDIGNTWGQMSGVLWWVCLIGASAATIGKPQHSYIDTVLRQTMHVLTYKSPLFEASTIATMNFIKLKALFGLPER